MEQRIPFSYVIISPENVTEKEGCMISTIDKCGFFFCQKGEVEVALSDKSYLISKGSVCIYMTGSLLRIQRISKDIKGIMLEVDLNYIIPIVNKIVNSENLRQIEADLYERGHASGLKDNELATIRHEWISSISAWNA